MKQNIKFISSQVLNLVLDFEFSIKYNWVFYLQIIIDIMGNLEAVVEGILEEADRIAGQDRLEAELGDGRIAIEDRLVGGSLELEGIAMVGILAATKRIVEHTAVVLLAQVEQSWQEVDPFEVSPSFEQAELPYQALVVAVYTAQAIEHTTQVVVKHTASVVVDNLEHRTFVADPVDQQVVLHPFQVDKQPRLLRKVNQPQDHCYERLQQQLWLSPHDVPH